MDGFMTDEYLNFMMSDKIVKMNPKKREELFFYEDNLCDFTPDEAQFLVDVVWGKSLQDNEIKDHLSSYALWLNDRMILAQKVLQRMAMKKVPKASDPDALSRETLRYYEEYLHQSESRHRALQVIRHDLMFTTAREFPEKIPTFPETPWEDVPDEEREKILWEATAYVSLWADELGLRPKKTEKDAV